MGLHELECTTMLSSEQLTGRRHEPHRAKVIPPRELAERVERQRAWVDPIG